MLLKSGSCSTENSESASFAYIGNFSHTIRVAFSSPWHWSGLVVAACLQKSFFLAQKRHTPTSLSHDQNRRTASSTQVKAALAWLRCRAAHIASTSIRSTGFAWTASTRPLDVVPEQRLPSSPSLHPHSLKTDLEAQEGTIQEAMFFRLGWEHASKVKRKKQR
jgi:hypothetical protein